MLNIPETTELIQKIRTRKEIKQLASHVLSKTMLEKLGDGAKIVEFKSVILNYADKNENANLRLKRELYREIKIPSYQVRDLLEINKGFFKKLVDNQILVSSYQKKWTYGMVKYFSYTNILRCIHSSEFKELKKNYDANHEKNVKRAAKANKTKLEKGVHMLESFDFRIRKIEPDLIYRKMILTKLNHDKLVEEEYPEKYYYISSPSYEGLDSAPEEDRNRWVDNYIRHHLTNYDKISDYLGQIVFKQYMYDNLLSDWVTKQIRTVYPFYKRNTYVSQYCKH
ncbi:hypothetical protein [Companilactobacillus sp. HBUAS59699]|uniref:hypothetical protein n=1 Tax=Companilactobacillus sp. HBUAS59699 TaxID=3109358 RepID=UPI002FF18131